MPVQRRRSGTVPVVASTGVVGTHDEPIVKGPGVVIGRSGSIGGAQFVPSDFWPLNTTLWVKDFKGNEPRFIYYLLASVDFSRFNVGSGVPTLNRNHIHPLPVRVPPLPEQCAIAHILGTLDDKIELNRRINETLEAMAQAIFKSWFVDFDPVRAKMEGRQPIGMNIEIAKLFPSQFVESELGEVPERWRTHALYDCAQYINGAAYRDSDFSLDRSGLPVVKINELKNGITFQTRFTNEDLEPKYRIDSGDILFSWSGSPDTSIDTFVWSGGPGWLNQHIFKVIPHRPVEKYFIYFLLRYLKQTFIEIARDKQTTGLGHVTAQDMKRMQIMYPPDGILEAFKEIAGPFFDHMFSNDIESRTLAAIRDALLPKLLSGEIRVKDTEKFVGMMV